MRLFTYLLAAALLWAVAASGPTTPISSARGAEGARSEAPLPPRPSTISYPR